MGMSEFYGTRDEAEAIATIHRALELGVTLLDTADIYGPFTNERLVGRALARPARRRPRRDEVRQRPRRGRQLDRDRRQAGVRPRRLRRVARAARDRHDRPLLPAPRRPVVPIEETVGAMAELVDAGKVRFLGLSEAAPATIRRAHAVHPISALQTEYSLWSREPEAEILPTLRELGIGFVAYSPLGRGFLDRGRSARGRSRGRRPPQRLPTLPGREPEHESGARGRAGTARRGEGLLVGQLALAWVHSRGDDIVPIPGTKRRSVPRGERRGRRARADGRRAPRASTTPFPLGAAAGDRYPSMASVNR